MTKKVEIEVQVRAQTKAVIQPRWPNSTWLVMKP